MESSSPNPELTTVPEKTHTPGKAGNRILIALLILMTLTAIGLGIWGYTERSRARVPAVEPIAIVSAFEAAFESGKPENVQALFTEDGILTTASNTHWALYTGEWDNGESKVGGSGFLYLTTVHANQDMTIIGTPIMVGENTVAFGWQWTSGVRGTALLHLRDGKIVIAILNVSNYQIPPGGG